MSTGEAGDAGSGALSPGTRAILAAVLLGILAGFLWGVADVPRYSSSATVIVAGEGDGPAGPAETERLAELGAGSAVAAVAAAQLGGDVAGADLLSDVSVTPATTPGTLLIEAVADSPDFATATADGFSVALVEVGGKRLDLGAAAVLPGGPSENRSALLWSALGLAAGLLVGSAFALIGSRRRSPAGVEPQARIEPREVEPMPAAAEEQGDEQSLVEDAFGVPVLASFGPPEDIVTFVGGVLEVGGADARTLRTLAEELALDDADAPRTVAILDAVPGDGAPFVVLGLAITAAELGLRVLVVEADLRHPALAETAGVSPSPGLRDYLQGTDGPRDVLRSIPIGGPADPAPLACVPAGEPRVDLPEGLGGPRFEALVERLPRVYDLVLFSGPPVSLGGDALTLARAMEGVVLVSADEEIAGSSIAESVALLAPVELLGGILTPPAPAQAVPQGPQ